MSDYSISEEAQNVLIISYRQGLDSVGNKNIHPYRKYGNAFSVNPALATIMHDGFKELVDKNLIEVYNDGERYVLTKEGQKYAKLLNSIVDL